MSRRTVSKYALPQATLDLYTHQPEAPSGALINAVLEHADIRQDIGNGHLMLRLSERRASHRNVRRGLGRQAHHLGQVSLIWDEIDERIIQVCHGAVAEEVCEWDFDETAEYDRFELTEAALAYVADHEHRAAR